MFEATVSLIALIFLASMLCQWIAWKVKLPAILFLLLTGITAGPVFGIIQPEKLLGDLFFPFVSLSVAIILFEGSITLKTQQIKGLQTVVRNLVSIGMITTWIITTIATKLFAGISWEVAALFGAIMVVTGPTVISPILRTVRPVSSIANILKWESIVIDPIGATLAVLVYEFIIAGGGQRGLGVTFVTFAELLSIGTAIGVCTGYFFGLCLRNYFIPEFLQNLSTLAVVFGSFALAHHLQPESGLVSVTVFGMWLANMKGVDLERILAFKETLSILLISLLFIILAARLDFAALQELGWGALLIFLSVQFLARPMSIFVSTFGTQLPLSHRYFLAWVAPRGIIAAAISALFSLKLGQYGHADALLLVPLTFMIIIGTVLLQSLTARPIAKFLGVAQQQPDGFLIVGSNRVGRTIASVLKGHGNHIIVADSSLQRIENARKIGLPTYLGNPISEHAELYLDTSGIGTLLAVSAHESENVSAVLHFRDQFGKMNIYNLLSRPTGTASFMLRSKPQLRGRTLFGEKVNYPLLSKMIAENATMQHLVLEASFDMNDFTRHCGERAVPLFAIDPKKKIHCFNQEHPPQAEKGWSIIYLAYTEE